MKRQPLTLLIVLGLAPAAGYTGLHVIFPVGSITSPSEPNEIIEIWDVGVRIVPPELWLFSSLQFGIVPAPTFTHQFGPAQPFLEPPMNPVPFDQLYTNFFSTARNFPNNPVYEGPSNFDASVFAMSSTSMDLEWRTFSPNEEGVGPEFVLFRLAIAHARGLGPLTLTNTGLPVISIQGSSETTEETTAIAFTLYYQLSACPGDVDGDHDVDLTDLAILLSNFESSPPIMPNSGDLDFDADIDLTDLAILLAQFEVPCP